MKTLMRQLFLYVAMGCLLSTGASVHAQENPPTPQVETPAVERADDQAVEAQEPQQRRDYASAEHVIVRIGSNSYLPAGAKADAMVSIVGSSTSEGDVVEAVVSIFGNTTVTGRVGESAIAVFGDTYVNSKISGEVVAVFGDVVLGPNADVRGDVVSVGGSVVRDPAAVTHGGIQEVYIPAGIGDMDWLRPWLKHCLLLGRPLALAPGLGWAWGLALGFLALYVVLALMFPKAVEACAKTIEARPGQSILAAFLAMLLSPVLVMVLTITVIGIAMVPFVGLGLFVAALFGKAVILGSLGRRLTAYLSPPLDHIAIAVVIGGVIVLGLYLIPVVGFIVQQLTGILGLGAVVYTGILALKARRESGVTPVAAAAGGGGFGPAGPTYTATSSGAAGPTPSSNAAFTPAGGATSARGFVPPGPYASADASAQGPVYGTASSFESPAGSASTARNESAGPSAFAGESSTAGGSSSTAGPSSTPGGASASGAAHAQQTSSTAPPPAVAAHTLPRATFGLRMGALLIDLVLVGFAVNVLPLFDDITLLALATYGAVMWKLRGTTVGGIVCGLQVVRLDGRELDWATAIVRALGCFLSLAVVGLGFIWIAIDPDRQAWHDKIAGTIVVRTPKGSSLV